MAEKALAVKGEAEDAASRAEVAALQAQINNLTALLGSRSAIDNKVNKQPSLFDGDRAKWADWSFKWKAYALDPGMHHVMREAAAAPYK